MGFNKKENYKNLVTEYLSLVAALRLYGVPENLTVSLKSYAVVISGSVEESEYSRPILWIGMYIALASLICVLAMVGDLLHGLRNRKLWFPCKYFTINAAWLTVIPVAMKLTVDLTASLPGNVDQVAKLGSMAFMCSMMANLLPSLATMDSKELFTNVVALVVLVTTLIVNIFIRMAIEKDRINKLPQAQYKSLGILITTTIIYVTLLLMLLIIYVCSALAILKSKEKIESQYKNNHAKALKAQQSGHLTLETLKQHVIKYWIMGVTGNPQFITVCSATTSATGVICVFSTITHIVTVLRARHKLGLQYCESDYQWSMSVIFVTQFIGVVVGTIAPLSRCFADLSFKMSIKRIWNYINVFKTESYWIQKLSDWKQSSIPIPFRSRKCKVVIEKLKFIILTFLIVVQKAVVVKCKMISLVPFFVMMCVWCCVHYCLKAIKDKCCASGAGDTRQPEELQLHEDHGRYVLRLHEELELHERTLKSLLKSVNRLIEKAEKQKPNNLMELLKKSSDNFEGVGKFDNINDHAVPTFLSKEYQDCWSLPVVTLTTIVVSLPNFKKIVADNFLKSVSEALIYVTLVEESLNATGDYASIQKAAKTLWLEVDIYHKWLGHKLNNFASKKNIRQILEEFRETAKNIVTGSKEREGQIDDSICRSIVCATSMFRLTKTILDSYNIDQVSEQDLFAELSSMISDIVAACLTNLPEAIAWKCHYGEIEKREANVYAAAQFLGETSEIINTLKDRVLPASLINNPGDLPYIDKWRDHLTSPAP